MLTSVDDETSEGPMTGCWPWVIPLDHLQAQSSGAAPSTPQRAPSRPNQRLGSALFPRLSPVVQEETVEQHSQLSPDGVRRCITEGSCSSKFLDWPQACCSWPAVCRRHLKQTFSSCSRRVVQTAEGLWPIRKERRR